MTPNLMALLILSGLISIAFTQLAPVLLPHHHTQRDRALRLARNLYESDAFGLYDKPQLQATHERNFTHLKCLVPHPRPNADVYISCPALDRSHGSIRVGSCYQGCQPTKPCIETTPPSYDDCVPNEKTVFCQKSQFSNGTVMLLLRVNRTDARLAGIWSCTHAGLESTKFEISLEKTILTGNSKPAPEPAPAPPVITGGSKGLTKEEHKIPTDKQFDQRPLAYMRNPAVIFTVLSVLAISVLVNLIFCIRCLVVRSYMDARQDGSKNADCLADCLCLPKDSRKPNTDRIAPILPHSTNWLHGSEVNGSFHNSIPILYEHPTKQGLYMRQSTPNHVDNRSYLPSGTLPRMGGMPSNPEMLTNAQLSYQLNMSDSALGTNFMPSYVRVPSLKAPSPNLSHRSIMNVNLPANQNDGQFAQQYIGHHLLPSHVIYDDVAAGTASTLGSYNRVHNEGMTDNPHAMLHYTPVYPVYQTRSNQIAENMPLLSPMSRDPNVTGNQHSSPKSSTKGIVSPQSVVKPVPLATGNIPVTQIMQMGTNDDGINNKLNENSGNQQFRSISPSSITEGAFTRNNPA